MSKHPKLDRPAPRTGGTAILKVVLTLLVRDEEDIIGENLEFHLSRGVDFVIAMDNLSDDGTPRILKEYERRGRLLYLHQAEDNFDQARWVTRMARLACTDYHADWVLNGDADEFWWPAEGDLKQTIRRVPRSAEALIVERLNFLPRPRDKTNFADAMIYREVQSRNTMGAPLPPKLCHRAFADIEVRHGNHKASHGGRLLNAIAAPITILHFPVRSYRQLRNKIEKGGAAYGRNREVPAAVGATWRYLYRMYREGGLQAYFESLVLTDAALAEGLETGSLIADDRLSRALAALSSSRAEERKQ